MLQNILNLEGVTVLGKKQLLKVNGGGHCILTLGNGQTIALLTSADDSSASDAANAECVNQIINEGARSCRYDCDHDGWGQ
ncbi:hypothetical protein [Winogradskyella sp. PC D3.3]